MIPIQSDELTRSRTVKLAGGNLSYCEAGHGASILFLHGLNGGARSWSEQFSALSGRHRVIAWDAPGYGQSEPIEPSVNAYADAAAQLLAALNAAPATIVGHSMGGIVAARLAHLRPDLVNRVVLSCTHWGHGLHVGAALPAAYVRRLDELRSKPAAEYGRIRAGTMLPPGASPDVLARVAQIAAEVPLNGLESAMFMMNAADNRALFAGLAMPVLIIDADADPVVTPDRAAALAALIPQAKRVTLRNVGHAPYLEDSIAYSRTLEQFLST
jgi:pimeloyl-ACP methyl ester carboxylesterase